MSTTNPPVACVSRPPGDNEIRYCLVREIVGHFRGDMGPLLRAATLRAVLVPGARSRSLRGSVHIFLRTVAAGWSWRRDNSRVRLRAAARTRHSARSGANAGRDRSGTISGVPTISYFIIT